MKKSLRLLIREDSPLYLEELRHSNEQLHALAAYLQYLREEERIRIAREVHDELGQRLTGMKLSLSWVASRLMGNAFLRRKVQDISDEVDATIQTVRRIATELRPQILDELGLAAAIEWQAGEFQARTEIPCRVMSQLGAIIWDQDLTTVYFRIFQEMLTNVIRHANATAVQVSLAAESGCLVLEVRDNGRGITEKEIHNTRSIGLIGMRERAALVGGEVSIQGAPGRGTVARVSAPMPQTEGRRR